MLVFHKEQKGVSLLIILLIAIGVTLIIVASAIILLGEWQPTNIVGSGNLVTQQKDFSGFSAIQVSSGFKVEISKSSFYSISITADDNIIDYIQVLKTGNTLHLGLQMGSYQSTTLQVEIELPELNSLELSGGTSGTTEGFSSSEPFVVELSGASKLEMQDINVGDFQVELSGASRLTAEGSGNDLLLIVSGASNLDLTNFPVTDTNLSLSGASKAAINITGILEV